MKRKKVKASKPDKFAKAIEFLRSKKLRVKPPKPYKPTFSDRMK